VIQRSVLLLVSALAMLVIASGCGAADSKLPALDARGVQCGLLFKALHVPAKAEADSSSDSPDAARAEALAQLLAPLRSEYQRLLAAREKSLPASGTVDELKVVASACAARLFPQASEATVKRCGETWQTSFIPAVMRFKGRPLSEARSTLKYMGTAASDASDTRLIEFFYAYPVDSYREPMAITRTTGAWLEKCLTET
jgi:hypothetical protein